MVNTMPLVQNELQIITSAQVHVCERYGIDIFTHTYE